MALRFRKSINLTKGVKLNLNKNSMSLTTGTKGAHFTINSKGDTTTSVGIPGSGLSYVKRNSQSSTTNSKPIQLDENICINNEKISISGMEVTQNELKNKINECNNTAILYFICSFTAFPLIGLLSNVIISFFIQIPYFVMAIVPCIAGLAMATFKLIIASDYKHMIKLYQIYKDKQTEKIKSINDINNKPNSAPIVPLPEQDSENTIMDEPNPTPKGTMLTYEPDQYFEEAGRYVIEINLASIGMIQRFYKIGFNRAARILDQLCDAGVVGPEEGTKPRKINMTMEEFKDYLNRLHDYILKNPITKVEDNTFKNTELYNSTTVEYEEIKKYPHEILEKIKEKFIAIDVETTGLDESSDYIVEISAVIFNNMEITQKFSTLVYSPVPISEEASEVNNLTDDMLKDAPQQNVAMLQFSEFIRDALDGNTVLVAHNSYFDYKFICEAFKRCGINATLLMDDTLRLSELYLNARTNKLPDVARHLSIKYPRNHRAEKDAIICGKIYTHFIKQYISNNEYNPFL